jgi:WD40 repeat protein
MPPRFSHSRAVPGFPAQNHEGRTPGHSRQVTIPPFRLTAFLSGLVLVAISLVQSPDQQEPEALRPLILRGHTDQVNAVAFAPDGRTLASAATDLSLRFWDVAAGRERAQLRGHTEDVYSLAFAPGGKTLASGSMTGAVSLCQADTGRPWAALPRSPGCVTALAFAPDSRIIAWNSSTAHLTLWDVDRGQARVTLGGHSGWIRSVAFTPDGTAMASGGADATVRLWDLPPGTMSRQMSPDDSLTGTRSTGSSAQSNRRDVVKVVRGRSD